MMAPGTPAWVVAREAEPAFPPLAIVGPTASGKSAVAMHLARESISRGRPVEIVSCDSMQVYRGMDIGTAKPTVAERAEVPHHLIDLVGVHEDHNLSMFVEEARRAIAEIEARGARALLVGGTGLYVRAIVDGFEPPPHFAEIVEELEAVESTAELARRLEELDPLAFSRIPPGNRRRLIRALEVSIGTGVPFSAHGAALDTYAPTRVALVGLRPRRDEIGPAVAARYDSQMDEGFLEEVAALSELSPPMSRTARQALGYRELLEHLRGTTTLAEALERARIRTRRFAVRQLRWFGRDPRIEWLAPAGAQRTTARVADEVGRRWESWSAGESASGTARGAGTVVVKPASGPIGGEDAVGLRSRSNDS